MFPFENLYPAVVMWNKIRRRRTTKKTTIHYHHHHQQKAKKVPPPPRKAQFMSSGKMELEGEKIELEGDSIAWTAEEEQLLMKYSKSMGSEWDLIAEKLEEKGFTKRSGSCIQRRKHTVVRRMKRRKEKKMRIAFSEKLQKVFETNLAVPETLESKEVAEKKDSEVPLESSYESSFPTLSMHNSSCIDNSTVGNSILQLLQSLARQNNLSAPVGGPNQQSGLTHSSVFLGTASMQGPVTSAFRFQRSSPLSHNALGIQPMNSSSRAQIPWTFEMHSAGSRWATMVKEAYSYIDPSLLQVASSFAHQQVNPILSSWYNNGNGTSECAFYKQNQQQQYNNSRNNYWPPIMGRESAVSAIELLQTLCWGTGSWTSR